MAAATSTAMGRRSDAAAGIGSPLLSRTHSTPSALMRRRGAAASLIGGRVDVSMLVAPPMSRASLTSYAGDTGFGTVQTPSKPLALRQQLDGIDDERIARAPIVSSLGALAREPKVSIQAIDRLVDEG